MSVYTEVGEQETQTETEARKANAHIQSTPVAFQEVSIIDPGLHRARESETDGDAIIDHARKLQVSRSANCGMKAGLLDLRHD